MIRSVLFRSLLAPAFASLWPVLLFAAPDSVAVTAERLVLRVDPAAGTFELEVSDHAAKVVSSTQIPGLFLDEVHQKGFESSGAPQFRNEALDLTIEQVAAGALALTWAPRDGNLHAFRLRLMSDDQTAYYGTGERFQALNQRGFVLPIRVDDRYGNKGVGSHKPVPFFLSSRGFGVWVDSFATGTFDLSGTERFHTDLSFGDRRLRVVLIAGPSPAEILETYTSLTGRSPVPPAWAFGLWKSRDVHRNANEVYEDIEKLRRFRIPASVLVIDSPWETGYNDFNINRRQFAEPGVMFRRIEQLGFYLCLWLTPFVNQRNVIDMPGIDTMSRNFEEAAKKGYLVRDHSGRVALSEWWKGTGGLIDFTNPAAKRWWFEQLRKTRAYGARAFKCDDGEGNFVPEAIFHDGTPGSEMKNRYSELYNNAMQEYIRTELGGDGVLIVRSGYTGVPKYPFAWAGDNRADFSFSDGLPSVILAGQNAAMSGISLWGSDIAGYAGTPDKELFIRWTQYAAFTPFMQVHMTSNLGPWDFDEEALRIFRKFATLRMQLFPYLYNAAHETARSGMPVIRPMALAYPADGAAHRHIYQYLFGPDLLVAPLYQPGTTRAVYLPAGGWIDYWSRVTRTGPAVIEVTAPLDRMPLFVRQGAILPMLPSDVQTLVPRHAAMDSAVVSADDRLILQVWPGASGSLRTWDGVEAELADPTLRISSARARPVEVQLMQRNLPELKIDGAVVRYDSEAGATIVSFAALRGTKSIMLREDR